MSESAVSPVASPGVTPCVAHPGEPGEDPLEVLRAEVGRLVVAHPGVLRLEPTLLGALHGLRQHGRQDGVELDAHGRVVDLDVNVATRATHQARASVLDLHRRLTELVVSLGYVPGTLEISVLSVEETTD